jgi:hypothetical protein
VEETKVKLNTDFSDERLTAVVSSAVLAGLIPRDQHNLPLEEIEVRGDFSALMQFVELMYDRKESDELMKKLDEDFIKKYGRPL